MSTLVGNGTTGLVDTKGLDKYLSRMKTVLKRSDSAKRWPSLQTSNATESAGTLLEEPNMALFKDTFTGPPYYCRYWDVKPSPCPKAEGVSHTMEKHLTQENELCLAPMPNKYNHPISSEDNDTSNDDDSSIFSIETTVLEAKDSGLRDINLQNAVDIAKQQVVAHLMEDFWVFFSQKFSAASKEHTSSSSQTSGQGSADQSSTQRATDPSVDTVDSIKSNNRKRSRTSDQDRNSDEEEPDDGPRSKAPPSKANANENHLQFACPYRKHNPQKYNVNDWRICALTPQLGLHRVK